ncbi:hypothetical protein [Halocola ammonii]
MKACYKYEFGYVNVDGESVYLTNTGNWTEIARLSTKTQRSHSRDMRRYFKHTIYLVVISIVAAAFVIYNVFFGVYNMVILIGLPVLIYYLYQYLKNEMGPAFAIPHHKLLSVESQGKSTIITYIDGEGDEVNDKLVKLEEEGQETLKKLAQLKSAVQTKTE